MDEKIARLLSGWDRNKLYKLAMGGELRDSFLLNFPAEKREEAAGKLDLIIKAYG